MEKLSENGDPEDTDGSFQDKFDKSDREASEFANLVKRGVEKGFYTSRNIIKNCNGRVVISHLFEEIADLASSNIGELSFVTCSTFGGSFYHFTTPCRPTLEQTLFIRISLIVFKQLTQ